MFDCTNIAVGRCEIRFELFNGYAFNDRSMFKIVCTIAIYNMDCDSDAVRSNLVTAIELVASCLNGLFRLCPLHCWHKVWLAPKQCPYCLNVTTRTRNTILKPSKQRFLLCRCIMCHLDFYSFPHVCVCVCVFLLGICVYLLGFWCFSYQTSILQLANPFPLCLLCELSEIVAGKCDGKIVLTVLRYPLALYCHTRIGVYDEFLHNLDIR